MAFWQKKRKVVLNPLFLEQSVQAMAGCFSPPSDLASQYASGKIGSLAATDFSWVPKITIWQRIRYGAWRIFNKPKPYVDLPCCLGPRKRAQTDAD